MELKSPNVICSSVCIILLSPILQPLFSLLIFSLQHLNAAPESFCTAQKHCAHTHTTLKVSSEHLRWGRTSMSNTGNASGHTSCAHPKTSVTHTGWFSLPEGFCVSSGPWKGFYKPEDALATSPRATRSFPLAARSCFLPTGQRHGYLKPSLKAHLP